MTLQAIVCYQNVHARITWTFLRSLPISVSQFQTLPLLTMFKETFHLIIVFIFGIVFCNFSFPTKASRAFLSLISRKRHRYDDSVGLKQGSSSLKLWYLLRDTPERGKMISVARLYEMQYSGNSQIQGVTIADSRT